MAGWDGPNRSKKNTSRGIVMRVIESLGDRTFTAEDLVIPSHRSITTVRSALRHWILFKKVEVVSGTGRSGNPRIYRRIRTGS